MRTENYVKGEELFYCKGAIFTASSTGDSQTKLDLTRPYGGNDVYQYIYEQLN